METILAPFIWILSTLFGLAWWIFWQIFWFAVWFLLPFALIAFLMLKGAEQMFGPEVVRAWLRARAVKLGGGIGAKLSRGLLAVSVLPFRVLLWFVVYAVWHSLVSLLWRPKWSPWQRAWGKRWRPPSQAKSAPRKSSPQPRQT